MSHNTAILTEDGAINSRDFWGYAIEKFDGTVTDPDGNETETVSYNLIACGDNKAANVNIFNFGTNLSRALEALEGVLLAIDNGDRIWDVEDYGIPEFPH